MGKKLRFFLKAVAVCLVVWFLGTLFYGYAFDARTCANSEEGLYSFLEERDDFIDILKISEEDRIKAVIYERGDIGTCYAVFEKKLFGLRLKHDGMDRLGNDGLQMTYSWRESAGLKGSKCDIIIYGDNRDGSVTSYELKGYPEIARSGLEADYILDIYIMDGIDHSTVKALLDTQRYTEDEVLFIN